MLNDRGFSGTAIAPIFEDILVQSIFFFTKVCFVHCPRDANLVAHCLAKIVIHNQMFRLMIRLVLFCHY